MGARWDALGLPGFGGEVSGLLFRQLLHLARGARGVWDLWHGQKDLAVTRNSWPRYLVARQHLTPSRDLPPVLCGTRTAGGAGLLPTWDLGSQDPPPQLPWQRAEATPRTSLAAGGVLLVPGSGAGAVAVPGISPIFPLFSPDYFPATSLGGLCGALGALRGHKSTGGGGTQKETVPRSGQDGAERGQAGVSAVSGGAEVAVVSLG